MDNPNVREKVLRVQVWGGKEYRMEMTDSILILQREFIYGGEMFAVNDEGDLYVKGCLEHIPPPWRINITYQPYKSEQL